MDIRENQWKKPEMGVEKKSKLGGGRADHTWGFGRRKEERNVNLMFFLNSGDRDWTDFLIIKLCRPHSCSSE